MSKVLFFLSVAITGVVMLLSGFILQGINGSSTCAAYDKTLGGLSLGLIFGGLGLFAIFTLVFIHCRQQSPPAPPAV